MTARIKLLGRMDMIERRRPQDNRIKRAIPKGTEIEMRLSTLPTAFGEKLVMRIFDPESASKRWPRWASRRGSRALGTAHRTGPRHHPRHRAHRLWQDHHLVRHAQAPGHRRVNVCTIEDPIEMIEPSLNQTQVQPSVDLSFAEGLRALMRQDPDIIMVGEIRDLGTAEMAVQASLTGHLVFSTLHTNDAAAAITRMLDLGVPSYLISATVIGVLAQRLVRVCARLAKPDPRSTRDFGRMAKALATGWARSAPIVRWGARLPHTGFKGPRAFTS